MNALSWFFVMILFMCWSAWIFGQGMKQGRHIMYMDMLDAFKNTFDAVNSSDGHLERMVLLNAITKKAEE